MVIIVERFYVQMVFGINMVSIFVYILWFSIQVWYKQALLPYNPPYSI